MLAMGMGNPLQAGTYYVGVQDPNNASSYTIQSRGIGLSNYTIGVRELAVSGSVTNLALAVGQGDYYQIVVPSNAPEWKLHLSVSGGEGLLKVQRDYLPDSGNGGNYGWVVSGNGGQMMMKPGDEQWALLPYYDGSGQTDLLPGTYYAVVVSQGQNLTNANCYGVGSGWGTGSSSYSLSSWLESATVLANTLSYGQDLLFTNAQAGGALGCYQFNVPAGIASVQVWLEQRVGNPVMFLNHGAMPVGGNWSYYINGVCVGAQYGNYGCTNSQWRDHSLITLANPLGTYSLTVYGVL